MAAGDITWFRYKRHDGVEQRVSRLDMDLPGHHSHYSCHRRSLEMETDSDKRKEMPICSGVLRCFPDALAEIAGMIHLLALVAVSFHFSDLL